ncbi:leucine-rich repeat domain-containing protein [Candidatus Saccharibacteria bacterium]|nr:leucine-rich repeat domain-containing protein [Candidatus Saccharibacteria bacterium]
MIPPFDLDEDQNYSPDEVNIMDYTAEVQKRICQCRERQLPVLDLSNCALKEIPSEVFELTHLIALNLGVACVLHEAANRIDEISPLIGQLQNLQRLYLDNNQLSTLPEILSNLKNLQRLYLNNNQLDIVPKAIEHLHNLQDLSIVGNQLKTLPETFDKLQNLRRLYIDSNQLRTMPKAITSLRNLDILSLTNNQLQIIPETIVQLESLQSLYLDNNQLRTLPHSIAHMQKLQELSLANNPLENPPSEIIARGLQAICIYLREEKTDFLYEAKLLLVGEGRVGKTSLAKSLSIPGYVLEDEQSTEGIDIHSWIISKQDLGVEKDFRLNIWDFGGQEIYHATHQFFLTKRSLYLLVTESRQEDKHEDFYYWLNIIRLLGDRSPVVIVLNKCDQPVKELPIYEYQQVFENIIEYIKVSCYPTHRDTITTLQAVIARILTDKLLMPHIGLFLSIRKRVI